jgi:segregation and condensation protein A
VNAAAGTPFALDLDVFEGPFDLLVTLILNEEVDLLEVHLAEIVLAYLERLEARGELDLEAATEFLILIAALLELKSRLMLPGQEMEGLDVEPEEAVEELLARLLEYRRHRAAAEHLRALLAGEEGFRYRSAPLPPELRRVSFDAAGQIYGPDVLAAAMQALLRTPPRVETAHLHSPTVSLERRLAHVRELLGRRRAFTFEEAVEGALQVG